MASKRELKRNVNNMVFDVVEECFDQSLWDDKKSAKADKLIDEAADFQDEILEKINTAKTKADFKPIRAQIEEKAIYFVQELNTLNK